MGKDKKSPSTTVTILQIVMPVLGTIVVAYLGYLGLKLQVEAPIHAAQTAEAKQTVVAQVFAVTPEDINPLITPTATTETTVTLQPSETPVNYADPTQFIRDYFSFINERRYEEAWSKLSSRFKENLSNRGGGGYNEYVEFWNSVENVEIAFIEVRSLSNDNALVYTEILYHYKDGHTETGHTTYKLVKDYKLIKDSSISPWLFDPN